MTKEKKVKIIIKELKKLFPTTKIALNYETPWELFVAVVLSAQTTDKQVNVVTESLFEKYNSIEDYINTPLNQIQEDIKSIGLYKNKAKNIQETAKIINSRYNNQLPKSMEELTSLPGVGRKTANVLLGNIYGISEGIAVDTHVKRLSLLFGLTDENNPNKIEKDLMKILPQNEWYEFTYRIIDYGRRYCPAHCKHEDCPLRNYIKRS